MVSIRTSTAHGDFPHDFLMEFKYLGSLRRITKGVTHDYNNIFTGLSGQVGLLTGAQSCDASNRRIGMLKELSLRGTERTRALFDFARYEPSNEMKNQSLNRIVDQAVSALALCARNIRIDIRRSKNSFRLFGCFGELVMMLFYLGENALDAMPGGGTLQIGAGAWKPDGGQQRVSVSFLDSGPGISGQISDRLFEPFVSTKHPSPPAGLGLYAALSIARKHGGEIVFEAVDGGTLCTAILMCDPVAPGEEQAGSGQHERTASGSSAAGTTEQQVFLVVEDDEILRDYIISGLQRRGHVAFGAESCRVAVKQYQVIHASVTVLLVDIGLADSDGYDCLQQLREINHTPWVIMMSGDSPESWSRDDTAVFLSKPFTVQQLEEVVTRVKSGSQSR